MVVQLCAILAIHWSSAGILSSQLCGTCLMISHESKLHWRQWAKDEFDGKVLNCNWLSAWHTCSSAWVTTNCSQNGSMIYCTVWMKRQSFSQFSILLVEQHLYLLRKTTISFLTFGGHTPPQSPTRCVSSSLNGGRTYPLQSGGWQGDRW